MMDVAARAGVSQATVSLVLNGSPGARLSDATKSRVRAAAEAVGYRLTRRPAARQPVAEKLIGFIADELSTDPWMPLAFDGAREKALEYGVTMTLVSRQGEDDREDSVYEPLTRLPLHGLIFGTTLTRRVDPPKLLFDVPSVLVNCYDTRRRLPSVLPGDLLGGRAATQRLIAAGRRRVGLINGQSGIDASRDRLRGYRQALSSADIAFDPALVWPGNWEPTAGYEGTMAMMALEDPPDGIFCANDVMALGCYDALKELGLRIPQDIAVVGFDDREIAQFMRPPLTTFLLPHYEMGATAVQMLLDRAGGLTDLDQIKIECTLVERESG
ncbi:LacI family DNA-binding transcriptional regulator [Wenxinia marina]|uniref:Transcriptional regulator, LacI family n=2 Tax=Wenxinia TaxID=653686 RepID=A0A0D0QDL4_9RHOB|nr:LacI family DNA-binding transcriptional regulator [Wenxinia marina]KIQ70427.1 transcriptional regulator, LacI family [Wenxinia marina DSM 24838]